VSSQNVDTEINEQGRIISVCQVYVNLDYHKYIRQESIRVTVRILKTFRQSRKTYDKETTHEKYKNVYILRLLKGYYCFKLCEVSQMLYLYIYIYICNTYMRFILCCKVISFMPEDDQYD